MDLSSYNGLKDTIASYLARTDLANEIPSFIQLAEVRLRRDLRLRQMLSIATINTTANVSTVNLPSDFLMLRDLHINTNPVVALKYDVPNVFYKNTASTVSGIPLNYTSLSTTIQLSPIPDTAYELKMLYYAAPPFLSNANATNTFLTICPDLLLYGALGEAEPYLMNDARLSTWASMYDRGLTALTVSDDQSEYAGSPMTITVANR